MSAKNVEVLSNKGRNISKRMNRKPFKKARNKAIRRAFKVDGEDANTKCIRGWVD